MPSRVNFLLIFFFLLTKIIDSKAQSGRIPSDSIGFRELKTVLETKGSTYTRIDPHHVPPKFMIDLYQERAQEDLVNPDTTSTVRCILGEIKRESLNFNLMSLSEEENVSHAEIHIFRKRSWHGKLPRIKFHVALRRRRKIFGGKKVTGDISPLPLGRGWKTLDVTHLIKSPLGKWTMLGMWLEGLIPQFGTGKEVYHRLPLDEHIRIPYKPFLIIFTTPTNNVPLPLSIEESNGIPLFNTEKRQQQLQQREDELQNSILDKEGQWDKFNYGLNEILSESPRRLIKRSVGEEEEIDNTGSSFTKSNFTPNLTQWARSPSHAPCVTFGGVSSSEKIPCRVPSIPDLLPLPKVMRAGIIKSKSRFKTASIIRPPFKFLPTTIGPSSISGCKLMERWVPFLDFDWAQSILAPASVPLHYCHGSCSEMDNQSQNQLDKMDFCEEDTWLERRLNSNSCCKSSSFRRLSVLYVDSHESIVLQSFRNTSVGGCSCL